MFTHKWGEMWGSNPRVPEPQSGVLTTSPIPPYYNYIINNKKIKVFIKKKAGNLLFSLTLSSPLKCLTSVFEMGTGVSTLPSSPTKVLYHNHSLKTR